MAVIDARARGSDVRVDTDICVVGAGAAGITIAQELAGSSVDVCLLESGGVSPDPETQSLYDLQSTGHPVRENFMSRARYFGGSCNLWAGRSMQLSPFDTGPRPWVGIDGWPIAYPEMANYFERAADLLGLPPVRWFERQIYDAQMTSVEKELFRSAALAPTVSLWARKPKRFAADHKSQLARAQNVRVILNANVTKIDLDNSGSKVDSVRAQTLGGDSFTVRARHFVLAGGGLENARLLLVSRDRHPNGVGNQFDQVGRYYMDHPRCVTGVVQLHEDSRLRVLSGFPFRHGKTQLGIRLADETQRQEGLLNHYVTLEPEFSQYAEAKYQSFVQTMKVLLRRGYAGSRMDLGKSRLAEIPDLIYLLTPKELVPHPIYRLYWEARQRLPWRQESRRRIVVYFCEQPPDPASRVLLSSARDRLGTPQLELRWRLGSEVERTVTHMQETLRQRFAETGVGILEDSESAVVFTDASHHMGTTRMSDDPRSGVVDRDSRVHGIENLHVAGSSVFPSCSHVSPTLAIVALSLRLADRLHR